jgi:hypothetical protein
MLKSVIHNKTFLTRKTLQLSFKHGHLFNNPNLVRTEGSPHLLSPDHAKQ